MSTSYSFGDQKKLMKPPSGRCTNSYTSNNSFISKSLYSPQNYSPIKSSSYADIRNKVLKNSSSTYSSSISDYKNYPTNRSKILSRSSNTNYKTHDYIPISCFDNKETFDNVCN